jgi:hypothetical protein
MTNLCHLFGSLGGVSEVVNDKSLAIGKLALILCY